MLNILSAFFGNNNDKMLKKFYPIVDKINSLEDGFSKLSDQDLLLKTTEFKTRVQNGEKLDHILPEAFANVREASKRVLNQRHFDVQLIGGIVLHNNMIAEMLTGEGKTLVSTLPAYLNALNSKGVHIITVNDYLAKRDSKWMGSVFHFLGLSVGVIHSDITEEQRKQAYLCDITYGTNNEFGFDYLRDNMKVERSTLMQRPFYYAIIDEVDSILIDEARTPLIISGASDDRSELYATANGFVKFFNQEEDFTIDEKHKTINVTEKGLEKVETLLKKSGMVMSGSLFDTQNIQLYHFLTQAIKANHLFKKEVDYIVKDNSVVIIDEFTGRMMEGRRFSDGLHQALEAKENLKIREENQTLASITQQNYFKLYPKLAGMTGTAMTERNEFLEIYSLDVVSIPSHRPVTRVDMNDQIYLNYAEKEEAIIKQITECYEKKQPVLIGTISIEKSETLSLALKKKNIPHNILNAKHHEKEAMIISQAGTLQAITIATNMAGRGTDIQLGGNFDMIIAQEDLSNLSQEEKDLKIKLLKEQIAKSKEEVMSLGGLFVIGTERHESRRIDNQLRGRSGRQGEKGFSVFFISLEDDLMRVFGSNKLENTLKKLGFQKGESVSHPMISKAIERAQKKFEQYNFEIRKTLLKFDNVINEQRNIIYEQRKKIMDGDINVMDILYHNLEEIAEKIVINHCNEQEYREKWQLVTLKADLTRILNVVNLNLEKLIIEDALSIDDLINTIINESKKNIQQRIDVLGEDAFNNIMRNIILQLLDYSWKKNLLELDYVKSSINLRAYANKDPFNEYQKESFILFNDMLDEFKEKVISVASHIQLVNHNNIVDSPQALQNEQKNLQKVGRNDTCPCGSGKKYKQCHGK